MIRGLIFDFDGLIVDTESPEYETWRAIYERHGCTLDLETWSKCVGATSDAFDPVEHLESLLGRRLDHEALRNEHREKFLELAGMQPLLPGVQDYLEAARGYGMQTAIASSARREWVTAHLDRLGIAACFDCVWTRSDGHRAKPAPDLYEAVLDSFRCRPAETVAFEDSLNGLIAAKAAGLRCVVIPNGITRHMRFDAADLRLGALTDMPLCDLLAEFAWHE